jgi:hypothetical protein
LEEYRKKRGGLEDRSTGRWRRSALIDNRENKSTMEQIVQQRSESIDGEGAKRSTEGRREGESRRGRNGDPYSPERIYVQRYLCS